MNFENPENIGLENIAGGAAIEKFDNEFQEVLKNIKDMNFPATEKRKIILELEIKPSPERNYGTASIRCYSKLPKKNDFPSGMYIGTDKNGDVFASENMPKQQTFADFENNQRSEKITPLEVAK